MEVHVDSGDGLLLGLTGLWRSYEEAVGAACRDVRFQLFRTVQC